MFLGEPIMMAKAETVRPRAWHRARRFEIVTGPSPIFGPDLGAPFFALLFTADICMSWLLANTVGFKETEKLDKRQASFLRNLKLWKTIRNSIDSRRSSLRRSR